jgi:putative aldouronate transport system permease protein
MAASFRDRIFDTVNYIILSSFFLLVVYPLYFVIIASFSDPTLVNAGKVWILPQGITLLGYSKILQDVSIWIGYRNTLFYTVLGTALNLAFTLTAAFALSRKKLPGSSLFMGLILFTMLFSGGLIPRYLLVRDLGMRNTIWAMMIPKLVLVYNLIIAKTFFQYTIPDELQEAAVMDGCSNIRFLISIVLPLSSALISVQLLFYAVAHWNSFFDALIFLSDRKLYPLQIVLREILVQNQLTTQMMESDMDSLAEQQLLGDLIKYGTIIVASAPLLVLYPFLQKHFVKGVMIGAIKG